MNEGAGLPWIDWRVVESVGHRLVPPGPVLSGSERREVVDQLRRSAASAPALVAEVAGLPHADPTGADRAGTDSTGTGTGVVERVVDRRGWVSLNALSARAVVESLGVPRTAPSLSSQVAGRVLGAQLGTALSLLGRRVLGQYDPFGPRPGLVLVAPTIVEVERLMQVDPTDFRRWVCLHEQTHRVQFATAPWLRDHLLELVAQVLRSEQASGDRLVDVGLRALRRPRREHSNGGLLDLFSAPQATATIDRVTAVMSLLEGHADVMMDRVGPDVVPSLATIRSRFEHRRDQHGWRAVLGTLLGMDAKIAQYRAGAAFCRLVIEHAGTPGLNRVWEHPDRLPSRDELAQPRLWLTRMEL